VPISFGSIYGQRWLSSDGSRAFFDTPQPLVPQDTNNLQDVYEWEQDGYRGCGEIGGCVSILSGGTEDNSSYLVDAATDGRDVFFATRSRLLPRDQDERVSLYDAREGGGFPEVSLACTGTGCQGVPPAPPVFTTPPSVTFSGTGNFVSSPPAKAATLRKVSREARLVEALKTCRDHAKHNKRKRKACEVKARRKYGGSHASARKSGRQTGKRAKSNDAKSRRGE
jgi:hypothetical protein